VSYCPLDDVSAWAETVLRLTDESVRDPAQARLRRETAIRRAQAFSWSHYAREIVRIYANVAAQHA
jgi:glycosyltransferase involved in cell wall biosynthesis